MNKPIPMHTPRHRRHSHGFTILEMSVVLVIIMVLRPEGLLGQYELGPRFFRHIFGRKEPKGAEERG